MAGKGKMSPCSYVNENATNDLRSLLRMKRKTSANAKDGKGPMDEEKNHPSANTGVSSKHSSPALESKQSKKLKNKRAKIGRSLSLSTATKASGGNGKTSLLSNTFLSLQQQQPQPQSTVYKVGNGLGIKHQLNGFQNQRQQPNQSTYNVNNPLLTNPNSTNNKTLDPLSIAKSAVGKGVTHQSLTASSSNNNTNSYNLTSGISTDSLNKFTFLDPSQLGMGIENCLSELQNNFRNSLNEANKNGSNNNNNSNNNDNEDSDEVNNRNSNQFNHYSSSHNKRMERESSLVDLAMIPSLSSSYTNNMKSNEVDYAITFIDFPLGGIDPSTLPPPDDGP